MTDLVIIVFVALLIGGALVLLYQRFAGAKATSFVQTIEDDIYVAGARAFASLVAAHAAAGDAEVAAAEANVTAVKALSAKRKAALQAAAATMNASVTSVV